MYRSLKRAVYHTVLLLGLLLCSVSSLAKTTASYKLVLPRNIDTNALKGTESYALFNVDVHNVAASFKISRFVTKRGKVVYISKKPQFSGNTIHVSLKDVTNGLHLLALAPGSYQITEITSPSYNLPYRLSTNFSEAWRFDVVRHSVSYAGTLFINAERSKSNVDIQLKNHFASDFQKINRVMAQLPKHFVLQLGSQPKDDFLNAYSQ